MYYYACQITLCNRRGLLVPSLCQVRPTTSERYRYCCTFLSRVWIVFCKHFVSGESFVFCLLFSIFWKRNMAARSLLDWFTEQMVPPTDQSQRLFFATQICTKIVFKAIFFFYTKQVYTRICTTIDVILLSTVKKASCHEPHHSKKIRHLTVQIKQI